jgi:NTP pyrophosphatase (non-canonical NTP hydrolase)
MASFKGNQSIEDFQIFNGIVYGPTDDRLYSMTDLLSHQQRFAMRALKGIRKDDKKQIKENLLISFSFLFAIANRLHINLEDEVWKRFPTMCSYCGKKPCVCKKVKPKSRKKITPKDSLRPRSLAEFQKMFNEIYPQKNSTLADAGVHFAEEVGEVSEATNNFLGQHRPSQFEAIKHEMADCISCTFGIANSAKINVADELEKLFYKNCHICHKAPCTCSFAYVASL